MPVINAVDLITVWHFLVNKAFNRKKRVRKRNSPMAQETSTSLGLIQMLDDAKSSPSGRHEV